MCSLPSFRKFARRIEGWQETSGNKLVTSCGQIDTEFFGIEKTFLQCALYQIAIWPCVEALDRSSLDMLTAVSAVRAHCVTGHDAAPLF
jgi:hypothetical protein